MKLNRRFLCLAVIAALTVTSYLLVVRDKPSTDGALATVRAYIVASYSRDFNDAYRHLSAADREFRDQQSFVKSQGAYEGFALEAARKLAGFMEIWPIERKDNGDRIAIKVGYRVPAPADLNELLLNWDQEQLNALSDDRRHQLLAELDRRKKTGKLLFIEGQEAFELTRAGESWKIFLDWASGTRVTLNTLLPKTGQIEVRFAQSEMITKRDELFLVNLVIKNRGARATTFVVSHLVDPPQVAEALQLIECGLLSPVTLDPGGEREFSMAYLLTPAAQQNYREFTLTYEFKPQ